MSITLEIIESNGKRRTAELDQQVVLVGRGSRCDLRLASDAVSSAHLRLKKYRDGYAIEDLNSTNGTFVNGRRLSGEVAIQFGDQVQLGPDGPTLRVLDAPANLGKSGSAPVATVAESSVRDDQPTSAKKVVGKTGLFDKSNATLLVSVGAVVLLGVSCCGFGGVLGLFWWGFGGDSALMIKSIEDDKELSEAVGFVICGLEINRHNGTKVALPLSTGTAFAVSSDGYMITNRHVVEDIQSRKNNKTLTRNLEAKLQGEVTYKVWVACAEQIMDAEVLYVSPEYDMSILKVERKKSPFFRVLLSEDVPRTTKVYAVGFPGAARDPISSEEGIEAATREKAMHENVRNFFKKRDFDYVITDGTISRITTESGGRTWVQHNADINHGNSGGPLCLENGAVVGINTLGSKRATGMFYSLSMKQLRQKIEEYAPNVRWAKR